jgi:hypothetical protein
MPLFFPDQRTSKDPAENSKTLLNSSESSETPPQLILPSSAVDFNITNNKNNIHKEKHDLKPLNSVVALNSSFCFLKEDEKSMFLDALPTKVIDHIIAVPHEIFAVTPMFFLLIYYFLLKLNKDYYLMIRQSFIMFILVSMLILKIIP